MRWHANGKGSSTFASVSSADCKLCGGICTWVVKSSEKSATFEAACPSTRGGGWAPSGPAYPPLPLGVLSRPEPPGAPRGGAGAELGRCKAVVASLRMLPRLDLAVIVLHVEGALEHVYRLHPAEAPRAARVPVGPHAVAPHVVILDVRRAQRLHARRRHVLLEVTVLVKSWGPGQGWGWGVGVGVGVGVGALARARFRVWVRVKRAFR